MALTTFSIWNQILGFQLQRRFGFCFVDPPAAEGLVKATLFSPSGVVVVVGAGPSGGVLNRSSDLTPLFSAILVGLALLYTYNTLSSLTNKLSLSISI
jgi:hypothetical protein